MPQVSNNTVYVYIDYYRSGLWGAWFSKHSWWERAVPTKFPNVMHRNPVSICEISKKLIAKEKEIKLIFSDAVRFLHQVESRSL